MALGTAKVALPADNPVLVPGTTVDVDLESVAAAAGHLWFWRRRR